MQSIDHYALCDTTVLDRAWSSICYVARRVLAIFAVLVMTYGLLAAEVELAKIEQITEPGPR